MHCASTARYSMPADAAAWRAASTSQMVATLRERQRWPFEVVYVWTRAAHLSPGPGSLIRSPECSNSARQWSLTRPTSFTKYTYILHTYMDGIIKVGDSVFHDTADHTRATHPSQRLGSLPAATAPTTRGRARPQALPAAPPPWWQSWWLISPGRCGRTGS